MQYFVGLSDNAHHILFCIGKRDNQQGFNEFVAKQGRLHKKTATTSLQLCMLKLGDKLTLNYIQYHDITNHDVSCRRIIWLYS